MTLAVAPPLDRAVGWRHGLVAGVAAVPTTMADMDVANWSATLRPTETGSGAGGVAFDTASARDAALAEAVERYAAVRCPLAEVRAADGVEVVGLDRFTLHAPWQVDRVGFPHAVSYRRPGPLTAAYSLVDNRRLAVPAALLTLDPARTTLTTSSGLAADRSPLRALLRAVQELIERDALMVTWLHGVGARRVALPDHLATPVLVAGGEVTAFDLTPAYSPHPVAAVAGNLPRRGRPRLSLGLACRGRWEDAVTKAWLEWTQGTVFAGLALLGTGGGGVRRRATTSEVTDFDRHAVFYTEHPERWSALPLWDGPTVARPADAPVTGRPGDELAALALALEAAGVAVLYRDLTTVDAAQVGLRVVRALAPGLVPIHGDHNWPHLGGTAGDLTSRYPWARPGSAFPNPAPHPLG